MGDVSDRLLKGLGDPSFDQYQVAEDTVLLERLHKMARGDLGATDTKFNFVIQMLESRRAAKNAELASSLDNATKALVVATSIMAFATVVMAVATWRMSEIQLSELAPKEVLVSPQVSSSGSELDPKQKVKKNYPS